MASYLRPRRGKKATAIAQLTASAPLKRGEVFFEVPDAGTGTGAGRIKMGDGSTAYESLPYFLEPFDPDSATVGFTNATAAESDPYTTNATHTNAIVPSANLKTILTNLKQLLLNYNSQFTKLNNDLTYKESGTSAFYGGECKYKYYTFGLVSLKFDGSITLPSEQSKILFAKVPSPSEKTDLFVTCADNSLARLAVTTNGEIVNYTASKTISPRGTVMYFAVK